MTKVEIRIKREIVAVVNGWEIGFENDDRNTLIAPYYIKYGRGWNQVYWFKSLKAATRWAERN